MTKAFKLILAGALLVASASLAQAAVPTHDAVRGTNGVPVRGTNGECVRTQWMADTDACAKEAPKPVIKEQSISVEDRTVYFGFGKATLTQEARSRLASLAAAMKTRKIKIIHIAGYADRIGKPVANEKLSQKRAEAVHAYLVSLGVTNSSVTQTRWFGDKIAAAHCPKKLSKKDKILCMQPDRRVEVEIEYLPE